MEGGGDVATVRRVMIYIARTSTEVLFLGFGICISLSACYSRSPCSDIYVVTLAVPR